MGELILFQANTIATSNSNMYAIYSILYLQNIYLHTH